MATHSSLLAWQAIVHEMAKSWTQLNTHTCTDSRWSIRYYTNRNQEKNICNLQVMQLQSPYFTFVTWRILISCNYILHIFSSYLPNLIPSQFVVKLMVSVYIFTVKTLFTYKTSAVLRKLSFYNIIFWYLLEFIILYVGLCTYS